jgi:hypothetical protein
LTALAARKRAAFDVDLSAAPAQKRHRCDDPLDLSSASQHNVAACDDADVDIDVLSVDPVQDPDRWTVDQVAAFVANVDTCQEYAEVSYFTDLTSFINSFFGKTVIFPSSSSPFPNYSISATTLLTGMIMFKRHSGALACSVRLTSIVS